MYSPHSPSFITRLIVGQSGVRSYVGVLGRHFDTCGIRQVHQEGLESWLLVIPAAEHVHTIVLYCLCILVAAEYRNSWHGYHVN